MALTEEEVIPLVAWDQWKTVFVKSKEDYMKVRTGTPQKTFWDVWKIRKDEIKALGISVKKIEGSDGDGIHSHWVVNHWKDASEQEKNQAKQQWDDKQKTSNSP